MLKSVTGFLSLLMLSMAVVFVSTTKAQTMAEVVSTPPSPADAAARRDYEAAFRAVLANPSDLDLTFRYAELAVPFGDLEGSIAPHDRLLLINPNLPHLHLSLLYPYPT